MLFSTSGPAYGSNQYFAQLRKKDEIEAIQRQNEQIERNRRTESSCSCNIISCSDLVTIFGIIYMLTVIQGLYNLTINFPKISALVISLCLIIFFGTILATNINKKPKDLPKETTTIPFVETPMANPIEQSVETPKLIRPIPIRPISNELFSRWDPNENTPTIQKPTLSAKDQWSFLN